MKYYAQFYYLRDNAWVEGVGDRQIIRLDGRLHIGNMMSIANKECKQRGYDGYRIGRGERLDNLFWMTAAVYHAK